MDAVEERATRVLERVPAWLWDGETLPVPVEDIADSVFACWSATWRTWAPPRARRS